MKYDTLFFLALKNIFFQYFLYKLLKLRKSKMRPMRYDYIVRYDGFVLEKNQGKGLL